jgi:acyl-CoA thioesterase I
LQLHGKQANRGPGQSQLFADQLICYQHGLTADYAFREPNVTPLLRRFATVIVLFFGVGPGHANSLNIVAIGASNTIGWGVGVEAAFPARLQTILRQRGIDATVSNAGVVASTTADMLRRIDRVVPTGTQIVILQPGTNDRRFGSSEHQRTANISAIVDRLQQRHIRVIVYDPVIPRDFLQVDGIHFTASAHGKIAMTLAAQITGIPNK